MALVGSISGSAGQSIGVTGSVIFSNRAGSDGSLFPAAIPGDDVFFFVSGSTSGKNDTTTRTVALFGGDTVISGSLTIGTGSIRIDSNEIRFQGGIAKIYSGTSGLTFEDAGGTRTLSQIIAGGGGGGGGTNFFLDTAGAGKIYTTASSVAFPFGELNVDEAADKGTGVVFYVSGSAAGGATSLFGGNMVTSGTFTVKNDVGANAVVLSTAGTVSGSGTFSVGGDLLVQGSIKATDGTTAITLATSTGDVTLAGDLAVNGATSADITTTTTTATLFNSTATTVNIAGGATVGTNIGHASGVTTIAGNLKVAGNNIQASDGNTNITLTSNTLTTFAGDIKIGGDDIQSSGGTTAISLAGSNVTIAGDLTVNGTTTTVNSENLLVKDPIILMASGASATNRDGGIAIFSGSNGGGTPDLVFGRVANDTWGAGKISTNNGTISSLTGMTLVPLRAGEFQIGGSTAFVSSSNSADLIINSNIITTFSKAGTTPLVRITELNTGEGAIFGAGGTFASPTISRLWLTGTNVQLAHSLATADNSIDIVGNNQRAGSLRVTLSGLTPTLNIEAKDGGSVARALIITGSIITIGSNDARGTVQFVKQGGTPSLTISSDAGNNTILTSSGDFNIKSNGNDIRFLGNSNNSFLTFTNDSDNAIISGFSNNANVTLGTSGSGVTTISGSNVFINHSSGLFVQRNNASTLGINSGGGTTFISGAFANANVTLGAGTGTGTLAISGSTVITNAGAGGFVFQRDGAPELHVNAVGATTIISGSASQNVTLAAGTGAVALTLSGSSVVGQFGSTGLTLRRDLADVLHVNNATNVTTISGSAGQAVRVAGGTGSGGLVILSGSSASIDTTNGTTFFSDNDGVVKIYRGGTNRFDLEPQPNSTTANIVNSVSTTVSFAGAATTLNIGNTATAAQTVNMFGASTDTSTYNIAASATANTKTKSINIGTGGLAGSTTNITLGGGLAGTGLTVVTGSFQTKGTTTLGQTSSDLVVFTARVQSNIEPTANNLYDLGTPDRRWRNMYTGDLHLKNERGNWTIIEEEDYLSITNNISGKRYKFVLEEI